MFRAILGRLILASALVVSVPVAAGAQAEADGPEGIEWHLAGYAVDGEVGIVPWHIDATLLLEDGLASGTTGCNSFSGGYVLEGEDLVFDEALSTTLMACTAEQNAVERGYLTNLPLVATWSIEDGFLSLTESDGAPLLDFEETVVGLTPSDVSAITRVFADQQAQLDRLDERVDNIRISTLRDRIKTLESQVKTLRSAAAASASASSSGSSTFTSAEKQLLKGIPNRIRSTCAPLRSSLPSGTLAAVRCDPSSGLVADMAYYLMPYRTAERTFLDVMGGHGVPERYRCMDGRQGQMLQSNYHATGCFLDSGAANLRLVTWAANCQQLDVNGKRIREPATYIAIEGAAARIKPLFEWATTSDLELTPVWTNIPAGSKPPAPACEGLSL